MVFTVRRRITLDGWSNAFYSPDFPFSFFESRLAAFFSFMDFAGAFLVVFFAFCVLLMKVSPFRYGCHSICRTT